MQQIDNITPCSEVFNEDCIEVMKKAKTLKELNNKTGDYERKTYLHSLKEIDGRQIFEGLS